LDVILRVPEKENAEDSGRKIEDVVVLTQVIMRGLGGKQYAKIKKKKQKISPGPSFLGNPAGGGGGNFRGGREGKS